MMFVADKERSPISLIPQNNSEKKAVVEDINCLPDELLAEIFSYLSKDELLRISQVSTHWKAVALDPFLWPSSTWKSLSFPGEGKGGEAYKHSKIAHKAFITKGVVRSFFLETPVYRCKHYYQPLISYGLESEGVRHPTSLTISDSSVIASLEGRRNYLSFIYNRDKADFQPGITYRWDLKSGKLYGFYKDLSEGILALASNGKQLAALLKDAVKVCDLDSGKLLSQFKIDERAEQKLTWHENQLMISYRADAQTYALETRNWNTGCLEGPCKNFHGKDLKLTEDKAFTYDHFYAYIYDRKTGQQLHVLDHSRKSPQFDNSIERLDICDDKVITHTRRCTWIWDLQSGTLLNIQIKHIDTFSYVAKHHESLILSEDKAFRCTNTGKLLISDLKTGALIQSYETGLGTGFKRHLQVTKDSIVMDTAFGIKVLSLKQEHILHPKSPLQQPFTPPSSFKLALKTHLIGDRMIQLIKSVPFVAADISIVGFAWGFFKILSLFDKRR